jgi:hypothetical protein
MRRIGSTFSGGAGFSALDVTDNNIGLFPDAPTAAAALLVVAARAAATDFQKSTGSLASSEAPQNLKFEREDWSLYRTVEGLQQKAGVPAKAHRPNAGNKQTQKDVVLEHLEEAIAKISNNGQYRFNQRQILYALRPIVKAELDKRIEDKVRADIRERILREARFEGQVAKAVAAIKTPSGAVLAKGVRRLFKQEPEREWRDAIEAEAKKAAQ